MTSTTTTPPLLLKSRDAAEALAISERTLWALTSPRGPIPAIRVGQKRRALRYDPRDLQRWIDEHKEGER